MRQLDFVTLDVFTTTPLTGNALTVFTDATGLKDAEMQALARETNMSETTFIFPREAKIEKERGTRVRIFTVNTEFPFAGHPTLGTSYWLHTQTGVEEIVLELNVGAVPVRFQKDAQGHMAGEMRQKDPAFGDKVDAAAVAALVGLEPGEIDSRYPCQTVSTGLAFLIVPVRTLDALQKVSFDWKKVEPFLNATKARSFYFICRESSAPATPFRSRMISNEGEDPATGSAAGNFISWAVAHGLVPSGQQVAIEQGFAIHRPSVLKVSARQEKGIITDVRVGGHCVVVAQGRFTLP